MIRLTCPFSICEWFLEPENMTCPLRRGDEP